MGRVRAGFLRHTVERFATKIVASGAALAIGMVYCAVGLAMVMNFARDGGLPWHEAAFLPRKDDLPILWASDRGTNLTDDLAAPAEG